MQYSSKILLFILIISLLSCTKEKIVYRNKIIHDTVYVKEYIHDLKYDTLYVNKYIYNKDTLYIDRYEMLSFYKDSIIAEYKDLDTNNNIKLYDYYYSIYKFFDFDLNGKVDSTDLIKLNQIIK